MGYRWVPCHMPHIPPNAVVGGSDTDGSVIYVGRANHNGDWISVKVMPNKNYAALSYDGKEIAVHHLEVLVESKLQWVHASNGHIPPGAVPTGTTRSGETMYIGRGHHNRSLTIGKVHPSHGCLYIPYGHQEIAIKNYEILISRD